jgi:putative membrane protein
MERVWPRRWTVPPLAGLSSSGAAAYAAILLAGGALSWTSTNRPALMPAWGPWDFAWPEYLAAALSLLWFCRGVALAPAAARPPIWRRIAFFLGLGVLYAVLQTHFDYMAQHMFFLNRAQHVAMHHLGPFLIALAWPGEAIRRGMPRCLRPIVESPTIASVVRFLQQPLLAAFLFVGLFYFWLIPSVHFRAMLDVRLYALMNWSMVVDGILFWCLVLDPRAKPPARLSFGARAGLAFAVMFPQILLGAIITFSHTDLYPYYDFCGRLFPSISALNDQHIGGIVMWIPPAMMSVIAVLLVLNALRVHEDAAAKLDDGGPSALAARAARWTGR